MHNYLDILLHYKRAVISALISVGVPGAEQVLISDINQLTQIDMWMSILAKLVGAVAGLYTIYEIRRKKKADELKAKAAREKAQGIEFLNKGKG